MKINTTLLKYIAILMLVILLSAVGARVFTGGESLSDYAEKNPEIAYSEPIPAEEPEKTTLEDSSPPSEALSEADSITQPDLPKENDDPSGANTSMQEEMKNNTKNNTLGETESHTAAGSPDTTEPDIEPAVSASRTIYKEGFYYEEIPDDVIARITGISYQENPHITLDDLRYMKVLYHDFSAETQVGELICNKAIAQDLAEIFYELYQNEYQIERIALVDEYDGDDTLSMESNNTSCFNYRVVDGTTRLSKHALGLAIDINPYYNPYIVYNKDGTGETYISPKGSEIYADRSQNFPYKIDADDLCYRLFKEHGFTWGGNWNSTKDYQHFQKVLD